MFKIKNHTGQYSTYGNYPSFTPWGQIWITPEQICSHLDNLSEKGRSLYRDSRAKVVELEKEGTGQSFVFVERDSFPLVDEND